MYFILYSHYESIGPMCEGAIQNNLQTSKIIPRRGSKIPGFLYTETGGDLDMSAHPLKIP